MSVEDGKPRNRFQGLVPTNPPPEANEETPDEQRRQEELFRRYGTPGASQHIVSSESKKVTPNQVQAGLQGREVPLTSRDATQREIGELFQPIVIFIGDENAPSPWEKGSIEDHFLQAEREEKKKQGKNKRKRGA